MANLFIRQLEGSSVSRATFFNRQNVDQFFFNLEEILLHTPAFTNGTHIFTLDEAATTTVQKPWKLITKKGSKNVSSSASGEQGIEIGMRL